MFARAEGLGFADRGNTTVAIQWQALRSPRAFCLSTDGSGPSPTRQTRYPLDPQHLRMPMGDGTAPAETPSSNRGDFFIPAPEAWGGRGRRSRIAPRTTGPGSPDRSQQRARPPRQITQHPEGRDHDQQDRGGGPGGRERGQAAAQTPPQQRRSPDQTGRKQEHEHGIQPQRPPPLAVHQRVNGAATATSGTEQARRQTEGTGRVPGRRTRTEPPDAEHGSQEHQEQQSSESARARSTGSRWGGPHCAMPPTTPTAPKKTITPR